MKIKNYINKIVENGSDEDMEKLSEMLQELIYNMKEDDYDDYCDYKRKLYKLAYGDELTEDLAKEIIDEMQPYGMHWTLAETENVRRSRANLSNIKPVDFWIVMNSAYNDYHELFDEELEDYVMFAKNFINDTDAIKDKVLTYFTVIPEKD